MQTGRILKTALAVGVIANIWDFAMNGYVLPALFGTPAYMKTMEQVQIPMLVAGDFVAVLVLVWFFDKVRAAFGAGAMGGADYGLRAGVLINFPLWIFVNLLFNDFPYRDAWVWTVNGIIWTVIMGAATGLIYDKLAPKK